MEKNRVSKVRDLAGDKVFDEDNLFSDKQEAKAKQKRMNKLLSPGEKSYYGLAYKVATVGNEFLLR